MEKFIPNFFWRNIRNFGFLGFRNFSWNIRSFLSLGLESFIFWNIRNFLTVFFFYFSSSESYFLKYKKVCRVSVSRNIRKSFIWENIRNFLKLEPESSISQNIRKYKNFFQREFFSFFKLGLKSSISWNINNFLIL